MKTTLKYIKTILLTHQYLFISVPILAFIGWWISFYFFHNNIFETLVSLNQDVSADERRKLLYELGNISALDKTIAPILILPLVNLIFIKNEFSNPLHFNLPLNTSNRFFGYFLIAFGIYFVNYSVIAISNYALELYVNHYYYHEVINAFEQAGYLYTEPRNSSIFYNSLVNLTLLKQSFILLLCLPFFLYALLLFKHHSILISAIIFFAIVAGGSYLASLVWTNHSYSINNYMFYKLYEWLPGILIITITIIGFYYLLKEREL